MENMENFEELLEQYLPNVEKGDVKKGLIIKKDSENAYVDIPGVKGEGKVNVSEVKDFEEGDEIEVVILSKEEDNDGDIKVSRRVYELTMNWDKLKEIYDKSEVVEGEVVKKVNGGYIVEVLKYRCFMPGSLSMIREDQESKVIGNKVKVIIKDIQDGKRKKILVSRKDVRQKEELEYFSKLEEGKVCDAEIKEIMDFGMSVNLGPVSGFIHISEVAWKRVDNLNEAYKAGDTVSAKIISINQERKSVKLSIKQTKEDPWAKAEEKYAVETEVSGTVVRVEKYGAFVELEEGIEGLVHVSDLSWSKKIKDVEKYMQIGDAVKAKVIELDAANRKLKLSIKQLTEDPWTNIEAKYPVGKEVTGKIVEKKEFGIFVEVEEGLDIFVHVSDLSWTKPELDKFAIGDQVKIQILELDLEGNKIKGGIKQLTENPWDKAFKNYSVGDTLTRKIVNITQFGLFVEIDEGVDGMVHISEASKDFIKKIDDVFKAGDEIEAKIIEMDKDNKRIKLSIKSLEIEKEKEENDELLKKYSETENEEE